MSLFKNINFPIYDGTNELQIYRISVAACRGLNVKVYTEVLDGNFLILVSSESNIRTPILSTHSNGFIYRLYGGKATPLCVPSKRCYITDNELTDDVIGVIDGIHINLYYNTKWRIGSRNCCDVTDLVWRGISYGDAIRDCGVDLSGLDINYTYSIVLCHPIMCPTNTESKAYLVSANKIITKKNNPMLNENMKNSVTKILYNSSIDCGLPLYKDYKDTKLGVIKRTKGYDYIKCSPVYNRIKQLLYIKPDVMDRDDFRDSDLVYIYNVVIGNEVELSELIPSLKDTLSNISTIITEAVKDVYIKLLDNRHPLPAKLNDIYHKVNSEIDRSSKISEIIIYKKICNIDNLELIYDLIYGKGNKNKPERIVYTIQP